MALRAHPELNLDTKIKSKNIISIARKVVNEYANSEK